MRAVILGIVAVATAFATAASAQPADSFYRGKTMNMYIGFAPGGSYDLYARLLAKFMIEHIPGKPQMVPHNMPGGGSRAVAGYVANVAPKDGTTLGTIDQSLPLQQAMGEKLNFDATSFTWIGNMAAGTNVLTTWYTSGVRTIADAKTRDVPLGATGSGSSQQPKMMNLLLGTRFKIVLGYPGGSEINLALERGEVAARTNTWASTKATSSQWMKDGKLHVVVQIGLVKAPDLQDVPLLMDLASNDDDRIMLKLLSAPATIGRPFVSTPGLAADRKALLRTAFDATMKDRAMIAESERMKLDVTPMSGAELERIIADVMSSPPELAARLAGMLGGIGEAR
ncbi:MAG TPA: tripartite tricarboxylate transporter substrate-binding protein [Alphaproteobacteria bacterium]|jgi:tripartite-type tricarboxylate transporter receptor subunit TctC|nr:tripartite tricarboxylate transporter substrate-binding protein [Alphaproteobacteria bacterium]